MQVRLNPKLNPNLAIRLAWERGLLHYKLYDYQNELFDILYSLKHRKSVLNCSRRFGKTTILLLICCCYALKNPNSLIRFVAPTGKNLKKIIIPIMKWITEDAPDEVRPNYKVHEMCFEFQNGSELHLYGTDAGNHDNIRGQKCDLGIVDEAAFCTDLLYIVNSILLPQTITCDGKIFISSTPNRYGGCSADEFKQLCEEAERREAYITKTIYDNKSISEETIKEYAEESGGFDSVTFQVEYLCKFLIDPEKRVISEWDNKFITPIIKDQFWPYYHRYVCMDLGVKRDFTCVLFAYYDFIKAKLKIIDEYIIKNMTSKDLVDAIKVKEKELFKDLPVYRRITDSDNPLLVNDLIHLHGLAFAPTNKTTLEVMVNETRVFIQADKLEVDPKCKFLIGCLEHGVWSDNEQGRQRKEWGRSLAFGHYDGLAALVYLIRNIDTTTNPVPITHYYDPSNALILKKNEASNKEQIFKLFGKVFSNKPKE